MSLLPPLFTWRQRLAVSAPRRVELHQDELVVLDALLEVLVVQHEHAVVLLNHVRLLLRLILLLLQGQVRLYTCSLDTPKHGHSHLVAIVGADDGVGVDDCEEDHHQETPHVDVAGGSQEYTKRRGRGRSDAYMYYFRAPECSNVY